MHILNILSTFRKKIFLQDFGVHPFAFWLFRAEYLPLLLLLLKSRGDKLHFPVVKAVIVLIVSMQLKWDPVTSCSIPARAEPGFHRSLGAGAQIKIICLCIKTNNFICL